jgi:hypothetical protein
VLWSKLPLEQRSTSELVDLANCLPPLQYYTAEGRKQAKFWAGVAPRTLGMMHDTSSNTFQACQLSQDHCSRFGLSTVSVRRPPRPATSAPSQNRLFRKNIAIHAESTNPAHLPDSPHSQTSPLVLNGPAGPPPEVVTSFLVSLARGGFARILNDNPICLELLWNATGSDGLHPIFLPSSSYFWQGESKTQVL